MKSASGPELTCCAAEIASRKNSNLQPNDYQPLCSQRLTTSAQVSLNGVIAAGRKDWHSAANGAVLSSNLGRRRARRDPAPPALFADAGLRWCDGEAVMSRMEDLDV